MLPRPNSQAGSDPLLDRFVRYLMAERNVSPNTRSGYLIDLAQLVTVLWGERADPPFAWKDLTDAAARRYLVTFTADGATATTVRRKLAAARTFCRFLQRENVLIDNTIARTRFGSYVAGFPGNPIRNLTIRNLTMTMADDPACDFSANNAYHGARHFWDWFAPTADNLAKSYYLSKEWLGRLARK